MLLQAFGIAVASLSAECLGPACGSRRGVAEDTVSLLQVSATETAPSRRSTVAKHDAASLAEKREKLMAEISRTRASLALMEADLKDIDESLVEEKAKSHGRKAAPSSDDSERQEYALISTNTSLMSVPPSESRWNSLSLLQTGSRALMSS